MLHFWTRFPASKRFRVFLVRTFVNFYWHQKAHEKKVNNCFFLTLSKTRYGDFNISNGWGMRSTKAIHLIFERNLSLIIIHHPAKFHQNLSRTFWDNRYKESHTHTHTHTHTHRHIHADENNTSPKTKFLGEVIIIYVDKLYFEPMIKVFTLLYRIQVPPQIRVPPWKIP